MWFALWALAASASGTGCVVVDDNVVLVRDLGQIGVVFPALDADTWFSVAPAPGLSRILPSAEVVRFARLHGALLGTFPDVCIQRRSATLSKELVLSALEKAIGDPDVAIEVIDYSRRPLPTGELSFPKSGLSGTGGVSGTASVVWRGHVTRSGTSSLMWARVRLVRRQTRIVAAGPLRAGSPISRDEVEQRTETVFAFAPAPLYSVDQVVGRRPRRLIRAGEALKPELLFPARDVERGETVSVSAFSGEVELRFQARAETAGRRGDAVQLSSTTNGKRLRGVVTGRGSVEIRATQ
jgi:flagella basal body P-ring formation protein FlgA